MLTQSSRLSQVDYALRGPLLLRAEALQGQGVPIIPLNIGNTEPFGFRIPQPLIDRMQDMMQQGRGHGYAPTRGIPEAIEAIQQHYASYDVRVANEHIFLGAGVSELARISMDALLEVGDEVLLPSPCYPVWNAAVSLAGGRPVYYRCDEAAHWNPDIHDMQEKISSRSRAIVVINPNNPTGAVYSKEILEAIANLAAKHNLVVMSDEIYAGITYDEVEFIPMAKIVRDVPCISFSGLSKIYRGPGLRLGWLVLSGEARNASDFINGIYLLCSLRLSAPALPQYLVAPALLQEHSMQALVHPGGRLWEQRALLMKKISEIEGLSCVMPKGSFYAFPKIDCRRFRVKDDERFCADYLEAAKVLIIHGRGFYWKEPDHVRIVFLADTEMLGTALQRLETFLAHYQQESH